MTASFDLAIVGGGPAGLAAALEAERLGLRAAVFEPQRGAVDKPCGEGILPSGVDALRGLGLADVLSGGVAFDRLRYVPCGATPFEVRLPRASVALPRPRLQRALQDVLTRGERVERIATGVRTERAHAGFRLHGCGRSWSARTLLACDGLGGRSADWLRRPPAARDRWGVRARFLAARPLETAEVHLGPDCEVYLTPLPGRRVNVACLFARRPSGPGGSAALLEHALERHPDARGACGELVTPAVARRLLHVRPRRLALRGAFLVGDAGGGVDPVLGCGLTIALTTGIRAARAAARVVAGETSGRVERTYAAYYRGEVRGRRMVAWILMGLGARPRTLSWVSTAVRRWPSLADPLVLMTVGERLAPASLGA